MKEHSEDKQTFLFEKLRRRNNQQLKDTAQATMKSLNFTPETVKTVQNSERLSPLEQSYVGPVSNVYWNDKQWEDFEKQHDRQHIDGEREPDIGGYNE